MTNAESPSHLMPTYARLPVAFSHGRGCRVFDLAGKEYLDALSGIAVNTLGHAHPDLLAAITDQAGKILHCSNLYEVPLQARLADALCARSGMQEVFFCNSGCEANEAAIKLARFFGHRQGIENPSIIVMEKAFHGRTLATLSATGSRKAQAGFEPLVPGFLRVPYDDIEAVKAIAAHHNNVVAVMLEIVQGEGGINLASTGFQKELQAVCHDQGWLMICDEVQCGMGRTGVWFGYQHAGIEPDIVTLAKGLGSGIPVGACLTAGKAAGLFGPGNHGSTFGGNPLACRAALATIEVIERDGLLTRADRLGQRLRADFSEALAGVSGVREIRGQGLMIGIELDRPCGDLVKRGLTAGLLINVTADTVVRLLPALTMTDAEAAELVTRLSALIREYLGA